MTLIDKLKELQGNKTQMEFAEELDISQSSLSRIYAGDRQIGVDVARKIRARFPKLAFDVAAFLLDGNMTEVDSTMTN